MASLPTSSSTIVHIVLFQFKPDVSPTDVNNICARMLALKTACLHPTTHEPYILSSTGGRDNSPEGLQGGLTHAFVSTFASVEDRAFYLEADPAHRAFVAGLEGKVEKVTVVDFCPGVL